ncbi:hypothetical protein LXL04_015221 [Taraxacum kok-saghyz]
MTNVETREANQQQWLRLTNLWLTQITNMPLPFFTPSSIVTSINQLWHPPLTATAPPFSTQIVIDVPNYSKHDAVTKNHAILYTTPSQQPRTVIQLRDVSNGYNDQHTIVCIVATGAKPLRSMKGLTDGRSMAVVDPIILFNVSFLFTWDSFMLPSKARSYCHQRLVHIAIKGSFTLP